MAIYIQGSTNIFAKINDWQHFDNMQSELNTIAQKHDLFVDRYSYDDGDSIAFFIHNNKEKGFDSLYSGEITNIDLSIPDDSTFDKRASDLLLEINNDSRFEKFHNLEFCESAKRYVTVS